MPAAINVTSTSINAKREDVFRYVTDMTRHGEWSPEPITVESLTEGLVGIGCEYRCVGQRRGKEVTSERRITEFEFPALFAFSVKDSTGEQVHEFTLRTQNGGTHVQRKITSQLPLHGWIFNKIVGWPFRERLAINKAHEQLKAKLE